MPASLRMLIPKLELLVVSLLKKLAAATVVVPTTSALDFSAVPHNLFGALLLLKSLDDMSVVQRQELFERAIPIVKHNYDHFYNGGFEKILWTELTGMLNELATDLI